MSLLKLANCDQVAGVRESQKDAMSKTDDDSQSFINKWYFYISWNKKIPSGPKSNAGPVFAWIN